jgi:hypothetical protein
MTAPSRYAIALLEMDPLVRTRDPSRCGAVPLRAHPADVDEVLEADLTPMDLARSALAKSIACEEALVRIRAGITWHNADEREQAREAIAWLREQRREL